MGFWIARVTVYDHTRQFAGKPRLWGFDSNAEPKPQAGATWPRRVQDSCHEARVSVCDREAFDMMLTLGYESHTLSEQLRDRLESLQVRRVWNLLCARSVNVICVAADVGH